MSETETQGLSSEIPASGVFDPPTALAEHANVTQADYDRAAEDRLGFWADAAGRLEWSTPWEEVLDWTNPPFAKWFTGGELNVAVNCVDRHVTAGNGDKVAYHWVGEPGDTRTITYAQLKDEVSKAANALTALGVQPGDRVAVYLPMIPEAVITMLACARIGAVHMVVFGGFSPDALASRIEDAGAKVVVTADGGFRRGAPSALKPAVDEALTKVAGVEHVLVVKRTEQDVEWTEGRDQWWHDLVDGQSTEHAAQAFDAEHPLYIMYTSGTTAKPKGILHTSGGYLTQVSWTHWATFDLKADTDVFWCAADVAWVTGHSYIVYGPLSNGATSVMYEGTPETPHRGRWWEIVQEYGVSILYAAPTVVRTFMKWGAEELEPFDLSTLRVLGSVGEPINPEAWLWYRKNVGGGTATVVDTWWQTETGAHMIAPMPGVVATKPGSAQRAIPGISAAVVDEEGKPIEPGATGYLVLTEPWPAMLRTIWGSDERYVETYWSRYGNNVYFAGDGAKLDEDGDIWLLGRVDDVMNVSGHRISTTEVESALVSHPTVAEAAVVGATDPQTGQGIVAFVILRGDATDSGEDLVKTLRQHVRKEIGPIASPRQIMVVAELPKTRSGKIMRRLLRDVAENRELGDVSTLTDSSVMELIGSKMPSSTED
ncbi:acetyl-coenzyme A synthetase [Geodermatophilus sp. Leaf369]|uniref:acetate--CoA ligase n=1 Tax=Geodermatophilus sp. Leaf369 TaxID=1736354 RepID=UPI0006FA318D|nr:acetate--CoA ligase [Geodermatophilus sp. Leaf369]KQS60572.1 acetyl-coenzyme A synthetase [Geodermatophilus sp. Leaf369]